MVDIDRWYNGGWRVEDRIADTEAAILDQPTFVNIYKGRNTVPNQSDIRCTVALRNNIPNFSQTAGSSGRYNDATLVFMPNEGVDIDAGDRVVTADGTVFFVTFINPEQTVSIEVQVINYSKFTMGV